MREIDAFKLSLGELVGRTIERVETREMVAHELHYGDRIDYTEVTLHLVGGGDFVFAQEQSDTVADSAMPLDEYQELYPDDDQEVD